MSVAESRVFNVRGEIMTSGEYVPHVTSALGRDLQVAAIDGSNGRFWIAFGGTRREEGSDYFYEDERGRFWFWVERDYGQTPPGWEVKNATTQMQGGASFKSIPQNEAIFRSNIEFFFNTRRSSAPWKPREGTTAKVPVSFSWSVVQ